MQTIHMRRAHMRKASLIAQLVKNLPAMQETLVQFLGQKICWRRDRLPIPVFLGFASGSAGKESACNEGDLGWIPGLGRSPGEGKGYSLQYFGLENSMDCIVHAVTKSWTRLSDFHFHVRKWSQLGAELGLPLPHYAQTLLPELIFPKQIYLCHSPTHKPPMILHCFQLQFKLLHHTFKALIETPCILFTLNLKRKKEKWHFKNFLLGQDLC